MGFSHKSHDKRSDKETQSPMLRVFKEIIQKEHKDTEKADLLKKKPENSNRKYTKPRSKPDQKVPELSSADRSKHKQKKKTAEHSVRDEANWAYHENGAQSIFQPYQSEKKDSWWRWKDADNKRTDDACSCNTCPLKKLMGTEYACVGCLLVLFLASVVITSMVVFKTMPLTMSHRNEDENMEMDLKKQMINEESVDTTQSDIWSLDLTSELGCYSGLFGSGYADSSFRDSNTFDNEGRVSRELANVVGTDRLNEMQGSDKLREFYKKLIKTDAEIKKMKKNNNVINTEIDTNMIIPERYKRSLKYIRPKNRFVRYNSRNKHNKRTDVGDRVSINNNIKRKRIKRDDYDSPEGYVIEKKKVLIHYKPFGSKRQFPKCSHKPKDSKSHEKHLKHPFYQNSQRLDDLLDQILHRSFPELVTDQSTLDLLFSNKGQCNHKSEDKIHNSGSYKNILNESDSLPRDKEAKEESSTYKTTNRNTHDVFKENKDSLKYPTINTYIRNITHFDQAREKNHELDALHKLEKTKLNYAKNNGFTDPSSGFMAKIHSNNINLETSSKSLFGNVANKNKVLNDMNTPVNYENLRKLHDQNLSHKILSSKIDHNKNVIIDEKDNFNMKGLPQDDLLQMVTDDTKTKKTFDMNVDYSDIFISPTSKINVLYTTNSINQEKQQDVSPGNYINDWKRKSVRKILQIEEENDDTLGYEDLKEILADEMGAHDEIDRRADRIKRNKNMPDVYNRNWKGPIPLYPDEINAIINQAAIENVNIPVSTIELIGTVKTNDEISDADYFEDYFNNKYDKLVEIAQAYSDYGVLGGRKEGLNQNEDKTAVKQDVNRNRLDILKNLNSGINERSRKGAAPESEGIRFAFKSGKDESIAKEPDIMGAIQKHIKILRGNKSSHPKTTETPYMHTNYNTLPNLPKLNYHFDKTHKFDPKTFEEAISVPKRTLKSIEDTDVNGFESSDVVTMKKDVNNTLINKNIKFLKDGHESVENQTNISLNDEFKDDKNNNNINATMKVSDFLTMMSDWFRTLAKLSDETNLNEKWNSSTLSRDNIKNNKSLEVSYPSYDSDMIENIGHRSRVLLAIEDINASVIPIDLKTNEEDKNYSSHVQFEPTVQNNVDAASDTLTTRQRNGNAITTDNKNDHIQSLKEDNTNIENKTISKRSVHADSKLNFWNEIYDDEYGVKLDYFEKSTRNKHSAKSGNFVTNSKNWIEGKVKSIVNRLRSTVDTKKDAATEKVSTESITPKTTSTSKQSIRKRRIRSLFNNDAEDTNDFAALTANMKKVVREATNAVKETRKLKVREDNKEESIASSLMQQLVRLMAEVVDFQVQQKTCAKLPPDLQKFLEWLTSGSDKESPILDLPSPPGYDANNVNNRYEQSTDEDVGFVINENHLDDRTQCLRSTQAVQELMKQYEHMNDEDKSKMTGVKEYLENQLNYLNQKASTLDDLNSYKYYKKRETPNRTYQDLNKLRNKKLERRRIKRRLNKFIKNYSRRHTRTTAGTFDVVTETKNTKKGR